MAVTVYYENDADSSIIRDKHVAVIGPGSSGDPRRPDVLVAGRLVTPAAAVELAAPPAAHERGG